MPRLLQGLIVALVTSFPAMAWAQFAYQTGVDVNPRCLHGLNQQSFSPTMTFTFTMSNLNPTTGPNARTLWFVYALDSVQDVSLVALAPGSSTSGTRTISWGTGTLRLRPRGFVSVFASLAEAQTFQSTVNGMIAQVVGQIDGPLPPAQQGQQTHAGFRTLIQNSLDSLITAVETSAASQTTLRSDIETFEMQDEQLRLQEIETIRNSYTLPGSSNVFDGAIIKLDLMFFQRRQNGWNDRFYHLGEVTAGETPGEEAPGGFLWKNDDNDNENIEVDRDETSTIDNEDDLVPLWWFFAKPVLQPMLWTNQFTLNWNMTVSGPGGNLRYWRTITKAPPGGGGGSQVTMPTLITANYSYDRVYLEGWNTSASDLAEVFYANFAGNMLYEDVVRATVVGVQGITFNVGSADPAHFEQASAHSFGRFDEAGTSTFDIIQGGEFRLFPCRATWDGQVNSTIGLRLTVTPARPNMIVWVRSFDVDDPWRHVSPVDNDSSSGQYEDNSDNRPTVGSGAHLNGLLKRAGGVEADSTGRLDGLTNSAGVSDFEFDVSTCMQPGNNFRIVAGFTPNALTDHIYPSKSDSWAKVRYKSANWRELEDHTSTNSAQLKQSPLLTLWRKLHIEVDRMGAPTAENHATGTTNIVSMADPTELHLNLPLSNGTTQGNAADSLDIGPPGSYGRFERGFKPGPSGLIPRTLADGCARITVGSTTIEVDVNDDRTVWLNSSGTGIQNSTFNLYDDDSVMNAPGPYLEFLTQNTDDPSKNRLACAYIWPVYDGGGGSFDQSGLPFVMNPANESMTVLRALCDPHRGSKGNHGTEFWTAYIQAAFQPPRQWLVGSDWLGDHDPDVEISVGGHTYAGGGELRGSLIYMETIADTVMSEGWGDNARNWITVHEIGWQFSCVDGEKVMGFWSNTLANSWFEEDNLAIIRSINSPGVAQ